MAVITKNNYTILATVDTTSYTSVKDLYEVLNSLKKKVFKDDERIVIITSSLLPRTQRLVNELLTVIDIPEYFVLFKVVDTKNIDSLDFEFSDSFCIYPWINFEIGNFGAFKPCCKYDQDIPDANITQDNLKQIYLGPYMQSLRSQFIQGEYPSACSACWKDESINLPSQRQRAKYKFREIYYRLDYQSDNFNNLQMFDLKLGNSCNLACNICDAKNSSKIADREHAQRNISTALYTEIKRAVNWADTDHFWNQLLITVDNLRYLDLYGGEPLMSKKHFVFLKKLIDLGVANNIKIDYNTNGTIYSDSFFELWQHFKEVKLCFSIDDIEDRFEAQRVGASWQLVCDNIKKYNLHRSSKFITEVFPTVNTQNVYWIPELLDWTAEQQFDAVSFNLLHTPQKYNILSLDESTKSAVVEKLRQFNHYNVCNSIISLLES